MMGKEKNGYGSLLAENNQESGYDRMATRRRNEIFDDERTVSGSDGGWRREDT